MILFSKACIFPILFYVFRLSFFVGKVRFCQCNRICNNLSDFVRLESHLLPALFGTKNIKYHATLPHLRRRRAGKVGVRSYSRTFETKTGQERTFFAKITFSWDLRKCSTDSADSALQNHNSPNKIGGIMAIYTHLKHQKF